MIFNEASDIAREVAKQTEAEILTQLNDLVSRGLLILERTEPVLVEEDNHKFTVRMKVKLTLKDKEYIEKLETENKELRKKLENTRNIIREYLKEET